MSVRVISETTMLCRTMADTTMAFLLVIRLETFSPEQLILYKLNEIVTQHS